MIQNSRFVFFGSSEFSVQVLDELKLHHLVPALIMTTPDKPQGRKLILTPNIVKVWAKENGIEVLDPSSLKNNPDLVSKLQGLSSQVFLVASYGKIIPKEIFEIPAKKTLNIHPSLLPKYRGASPIQSQILNDEKEIGVSIMVITEGMDEGPVVVQKKLLHYEEDRQNENFDLRGNPSGRSSQNFHFACLGRNELEKVLATEGARLFAHILPEWLEGVIDPIPQNEELATYCKKIKKEDGQIDLQDDPYQNLLKIKALEGWPGTYFFQGNKRVLIKKACIEDSKLKIERVIPEGKKEMPYEDFLRGTK
jgi:methionyl-tRNA formyltransferase